MAKYYNETQRKSAQKYLLKNCLSVSFRLNKVTEQDLIEIYQSIPKNQKAELFKQALRDYKEKNQK